MLLLFVCVCTWGMLAHQYVGPQLHWADPRDGAGLEDTRDIMVTIVTNNVEEDIILVPTLGIVNVDKLGLLHSEIKFSKETNKMPVARLRRINNGPMYKCAIRSYSGETIRFRLKHKARTQNLPLTLVRKYLDEIILSFVCCCCCPSGEGSRVCTEPLMTANTRLDPQLGTSRWYCTVM